MNFKAEMRERFERLEREVRGLATMVQSFQEKFMESESKRDEIEQQFRVAQTAKLSSLYQSQIEEDQDEDLIGETVEMQEKLERFDQ